MKAKVIGINDTGEIVDVKFIFHKGVGNSMSFWWCESKGKYYYKNELEFFVDKDKLDLFIEWEQRRYEIAKDAMSKILAGSDMYKINQDVCKDVAKLSVKFADALIEELIKGQ